MNTYRAGIDIGSTTVKLAVLDEANHLVYGNYCRHQANTQGALAELLKESNWAERMQKSSTSPAVWRNG